MVVALEPTEAIRVLPDYGNPGIKVLCNTRPIHSIGVICGEQKYPSLDEIKNWINELSEQSWFLDATGEAVKLGNPLLSNSVCVGALAAAEELPLTRKGFMEVVVRKMPSDQVDINLSAFDTGVEMIKARHAIGP
jgi:indolepyruvate ferredoxin oxidoreductase beta subunit